MPWHSADCAEYLARLHGHQAQVQPAVILLGGRLTVMRRRTGVNRGLVEDGFVIEQTKTVPPHTHTCMSTSVFITALSPLHTNTSMTATVTGHSPHMKACMQTKHCAKHNAVMDTRAFIQ